MYDARGNIKYKSDVGQYWYDNASYNMIKTIKFGCLTCTTSGVLANPTAVTAGMTVTAPNTNSQALTLAGTPFEKSLSFIYGPEHQRIKQVAVGGPNPGTTWYLNGEDSLGLSYEKEQKDAGANINGTTNSLANSLAITEHKHYLQAGGITFAMFTMRHATVGGTLAAPALPTTIQASTTSYLHHDQLDSIIAISDQLGAVVERLAYDPWGKRRFVNGKPDTLDAITGQYIDRGFTMHEHMDEMGIINMNGRIYDPLIGRFMSADPYIQAPDDLQSHNRYAYVMNNPLNLDDPSGYFSISKAWKKVWKNPIFKAVVGIVVAIYAPALLQTWMPTLFGAVGTTSFVTTVATGALSGFASTGTLKGALTGAFTAGIMFGAGSLGDVLKDAGFDMASGGVGKVAIHAGAGCLSSVAGGGSCKNGAISGALGELGQNIGTGNSIELGAIKSAMLGGIGSKITGGKFADGAITGAFGYLFNACMHGTVCQRTGSTYDANDTRGGLNSSGKSAVYEPGTYNPNAAAEVLVTGALLLGSEVSIGIEAMAGASALTRMTGNELGSILGGNLTPGSGRSLINEALGSSVKGALNALEVIKVPSGVSSNQIGAYRELIQRIYKTNPSQVHVLRMEWLDKALLRK